VSCEFVVLVFSTSNVFSDAACLVAITLLLALYTFRVRAPAHPRIPKTPGGKAQVDDSTLHWKTLQQHYPVTQFKRLPSGSTLNIPRIQHDFDSGESSEAKAMRLKRLQAVKQSFIHTWDGYKTYAWMKDEVAPISGTFRDSFGWVDCYSCRLPRYLIDHGATRRL